MYNNTNPAELYNGTTWELLANDKYLKTTTGTPLSSGGSNSFKIEKVNLPAQKLQLDSFSLTRGTMEIKGSIPIDEYLMRSHEPAGAFYKEMTTTVNQRNSNEARGNIVVKFQASRSWTGSTSLASPYTTNMGSGTAITINPTYITVRTWKRLS